MARDFIFMRLFAELLTRTFLSSEIIEQHNSAMDKRQIRIDPKCLHWTPKDWSVRAKW